MPILDSWSEPENRFSHDGAQNGPNTCRVSILSKEHCESRTQEALASTLVYNLEFRVPFFPLTYYGNSNNIFSMTILFMEMLNTLYE